MKADGPRWLVGRVDAAAARWLPAAVLAGLGTWLLLHQNGLWYDELYTARIAPLPLADLARAVLEGTGPISYLRDSPPSYNAPYYAVLHLWLDVPGIQADELGMRSFSLMCAAGGIALVSRAILALVGARPALFGGLVVALNPLVIEYAVEARPYGLTMLASGALLLSLAHWLRGGRHGLALLAGAAVAAGLAHWFALLVVAAAGLAALILGGRRGRTAAALLAAGSMPVVIIIAIAVVNGVGASGAEWIGGVGAAVAPLFLRSWTGRHHVLLASTVALAAVGLREVVRRPDGRPNAAAVVATCWVVAPLAAVTVIELIRPVFVGRYLLPAGLGLGLLMAIGATALPRAAAIAACALVLGASAHATATGPHHRPKDDVRAAVALIAMRHVAGEPVLAAGRWESLGLDHYARDHPGLRPHVLLHQRTAPSAPTVWVVRRPVGGVKGDAEARAALDGSLAAQGSRVAEEHVFRGRFADSVAQRWVLSSAD